MDDFDVFKERMFGSGDKKPPPHRRALLFVDNAGADIVLGMIPLARELLRRGTEVSNEGSCFSCVCCPVCLVFVG